MSNQLVDTRLLGWVGSPAVYYVDSARGDNDNSGRAVEVPLRTISAALLLAKAETLAGVVVLLAPGSTYLDPAAEANGYAADITFGVIGGDSVPASIAPKLAPATWTVTNGRKWRFAGLCFVDATRIEGMGRMELVDCVAQQSATLQFACAGSATDCDFSRSTSVQIGAGADVYSNGTAWGNALTIVGNSASNRALLTVDNDVVVSPSVGLGGRLEMLGGKLRQRTGAAHSVGVSSGGELWCKSVRVEKADGTTGTISMTAGSTKAFVDVEYDDANSADTSTDASPEVYIRVRGSKIPVLNTNEIWVNHKSTIGSDTTGFGTLHAPYATVNHALSRAQYPCQIIVGVNSAAVTENVTIPSIATNLQIVASSLSDRNGLLSWAGKFAINFHATSIARHTWRGITFTNSVPFAPVNGQASPVIAVENCSFVGVVGQIAPIPLNFIGTVTFRGIDMTSSPQGAIVINNNSGTYNFENQHSGVAIALASGNTGAGVTITVNGSCSMGQIAVPLNFAGTLNSLQQEVPAVTIVSNQAELDAILNSTTASPPVFVLANGFTPNQNALLRGAIMGHAAFGGVAFNWIERAAAFVSPFISDIFGETWERTNGPLATWVKLNERIVSILTATPTAATPDGLHILGAGVSTDGLSGSIVRISAGAIVQRFFTYEQAPAVVSVGVGSAVVAYLKSGSRNWSPVSSVIDRTYRRYVRVATQHINGASLVAGTRVIFTQSDSSLTSIGSDVTLNTLTGQITLAAGRTYKIRAGVPKVVFNTSGLCRFLLWNERTDAAFGGQCQIISPANTSVWGAMQGPAFGAITTAEETIISFRLAEVAGAVTYLSNGDLPEDAQAQPWIEIETVETHTSVSALVNIPASINSPLAGQVLTYDGARARWTNADPGEPNYTFAGSVTGVGIGATITTPTVGATTRSAVYYKRLGPKTHRVEIALETTNSGGATGTGDYLLTLPYGLTFDTSFQHQYTYAGASADLGLANALPSSKGTFYKSDPISCEAFVVPYDANRYRVFLFRHGIAFGWWGTAGYPLQTGIIILKLSFDFQSP